MQSGALKQVDPNVSVILSSGFDEGEAARQMKGAKPAKFLQKPFTSGRLVEIVASAPDARKIVAKRQRRRGVYRTPRAWYSSDRVKL